MDQKLPGLPQNHVLVINKNHPMVEGLAKLNSQSIIIGSEGKSSNEDLSKDISIHLYEMACLSIGGLEPQAIANFQNRSSDLIGKLMSKAI